MKRRNKRSINYFIFFFIVVVYLCLSGCNETSQNNPIINSFTSNVYILEAGYSPS